MSKNDTNGADNEGTDAPLIDLNEGSIKKLIARAKRRGVITYDELNEALPQDMSSDQIEDITSALNEMGVNIVDNDEDAESQENDDRDSEDDNDDSEGDEVSPRVNVDPAKKKETVERTDDPVRMYLREMGAVELLSREGEIAIAKRIEAGRDMMILGLCESPITFHAIIQWSEALNNGEMQLREILDLDAMLSKEPAPEALSEDGESEDDGEISEKTAGPSFKDDDSDDEDNSEELDEDGNPIPKRQAEEEEEDNTLSLAQMEAALKPEALEKFLLITELFQTFERLQRDRLEALALGIDFPAAKEDQYQQLREDLTAQVESVKFHATKIEYLVDNLYAFNRRLTTLGGQMLRLAERHKVKRTDFLESYVGRELDDTWITDVAKKDKKWAAFAENEADPVERIRLEVSDIAAATGMALPSSAASSTWSRRRSVKHASPRRKWSRRTCVW
ncbi:RNA polymerase sigma factor region1.1 domain-containing protein [Novosphingobium resinovorum]